VGHAAAHSADSYLAGEATGGFSHVAGGLLIADVYQAQASFLTCPVQGVQTVAAKGSNKWDASSLQFLYEELDAFHQFLLV
jgi:hypothetical protein